MLLADWKRHWCLVVYLGAHGRIAICFQIFSQCAALLAVLAFRISGVYTEFQLVADDDTILDLDIPRIIDN